MVLSTLHADPPCAILTLSLTDHERSRTMAGMTDFISRATWVDIFTIWFVLVDDAYLTLEARLGRWRRRGPHPHFSDSEVITLALIIETFFHGNEELGLSFVRQYH